MGQSIRGTKKRPGRPASTGTGLQIQVRMLPDLVRELDEWIIRQSDRPSRPEAVRRLVQRALGRGRRGTKSLRPDQLNAQNDG